MILSWNVFPSHRPEQTWSKPMFCLEMGKRPTEYHIIVPRCRTWKCNYRWHRSTNNTDATSPVLSSRRDDQYTLMCSLDARSHIIQLEDERLDINEVCFLGDRLCGLVVRVLGYRSEGPGSIPGTTRKKKSSGSGTGSTQPREYNWGATW
jgi:hypothetical protein